MNKQTNQPPNKHGRSQYLLADVTILFLIKTFTGLNKKSYIQTLLHSRSYKHFEHTTRDTVKYDVSDKKHTVHNFALCILTV